MPALGTINTHFRELWKIHWWMVANIVKDLDYVLKFSGFQPFELEPIEYLNVMWSEDNIILSAHTYYMTWEWYYYFNTYVLLGNGSNTSLAKEIFSILGQKKWSFLREPLFPRTWFHFHLGPGGHACVHFSPDWPDTVLWIQEMP